MVYANVISTGYAKNDGHLPPPPSSGLFNFFSDDNMYHHIFPLFYGYLFFSTAALDTALFLNFILFFIFGFYLFLNRMIVIERNLPKKKKNKIN